MGRQKVTVCLALYVILSDCGDVMEYPAGIQAFRRAHSMSTQALAELCGVSRRTVEGWEQGRRMVSAAALNVMQQELSSFRPE